MDGADDRQEMTDEDRRSFELIGDRFIAAHMALRQSTRRQRLQRNLYTIGGKELTPVQIDTLEILARRPEWRVGELARELDIDPSTASRTLNPLVELGLASRETATSDRRSVIVRVTAEGERAAAAIVEGRRRLMWLVLGKLLPDRRVLLTDLLEEYLAALDAVGELVVDDEA